MYEAFKYLHIQSPKETNVLNVLSESGYLPEYAKYSDQLATMEREFMLKVIVGEEPLSAVDQFVEKFKKAGAEKVYNEVNEWYQKAYKK
jgi:hypothetical protein